MKIKKRFWAIMPVLMVSCVLYTACKPYREFTSMPVYKGAINHDQKPLMYDKNKKTVVIVANNEGTEIFDLMAPYYLFNATAKANVYVVAEKQQPIVLLKGLFIYPSATFKELDSLGIKPDVVVIPAMIKVFMDTKSPVITWMKAKANHDTKILSICAGSLAAAATGLYDGKPLTTHASQFEESKEFFKNPHWIQNVSVTKSDNLYSTAGVSNAVEGSLTIIDEMFGKETLKKVMAEIHYPYAEIQVAHHSLAVKTANKITIAKKLIFRKNKKVGVLLQDGINEFMLAAVLDTYHRTFPASMESILNNGTSITSKFGLTILPTSNTKDIALDEVHILVPNSASKSDLEKYGDISVIKYNQAQNQYIIDQCLLRIKDQYGPKFENITKLLLDYN